jgi:hypothetical protein
MSEDRQLDEKVARLVRSIDKPVPPALGDVVRNGLLDIDIFAGLTRPKPPPERASGWRGDVRGSLSVSTASD